MVRAGLSTAVRLTDRLSALADFRTENAHAPRPYGLYVRFKPFEARDFDLQAGRIPTAQGYRLFVDSLLQLQAPG